MAAIEKEVILTTVTDRSQLELLTSTLGTEGYEVVAAQSLPELLGKLNKESKISLAVVDVSAFDESVWASLEELNKNGIPFIIISPGRSPSVQRDSLKHGARGLFTRGIHFKDLLEHIHTLLGK
jgi:DNA-binding NtrC family response regulator